MLISSANAQAATSNPDLAYLAQFMPILIIISVIVLIIRIKRSRAWSRGLTSPGPGLLAQDIQVKQQRIVVKSYKGKQTEAQVAYQNHSAVMAAQGYVPISQSYVAGTYTGGEFFIAFLLCFLLIGIIVYIYMLIVRPPGTLTVTYELRFASSTVQTYQGDEKVCPKCAESVKAAAVICRFCGHNFTDTAA